MKKILDVGQCDYDHGRISTLLSRLDAQVARAHSGEEALDMIAKQRFDLVLVNRVTDRDGSDGLAILENILAHSVPAMLISNYPEYQNKAIALGALKGFGKNGLHNGTAEKIVCGVFTTEKKES